MPRPLRIEIAGGRYPVMARGNERRDIFRKESDSLHFLEILEEVPARVGTSLHAYALVKNHYLGQRRGRMSLVELGERAGGMNYAAAGAAISRFSRQLNSGPCKARLRHVEKAMSSTEI